MLPLSRLGCPLSLKTPNMGNPGSIAPADCREVEVCRCPSVASARPQKPEGVSPCRRLACPTSPHNLPASHRRNGRATADQAVPAWGVYRVHAWSALTASWKGSSLCGSNAVHLSALTVSLQVVRICVGVPIPIKMAGVLLPRAVGKESVFREEAIAASSLTLGHARVSATHRTRAVQLEPLLGVHPYLTSDGSHCLSGACSQVSMSVSRQPTERAPRRTGAGKLRSFTFL